MISKVAMSVCALIVATAVGHALIEGRAADDKAELEGVLRVLCDGVSTIALRGVESDLDFPVPRTADGDVLRLEISVYAMILRSANIAVVAHPCTPLHLWEWNGSEVRSSAIADLDGSHGPLEASSGEVVRLQTRWVVVDSSPKLLAFVSVYEVPCRQSDEAMSSTASASESTSSAVLYR